MLKEGDYVHIEAVQDSWYKLPQVDKQSASQKRLRSSVLVGGRPSWFAPAFWDLGRGHQLRARRGQQKRFRLLGPSSATFVPRRRFSTTSRCRQGSTFSAVLFCFSSVCRLLSCFVTLSLRSCVHARASMHMMPVVCMGGDGSRVRVCPAC